MYSKHGRIYGIKLPDKEDKHMFNGGFLPNGDIFAKCGCIYITIPKEAMSDICDSLCLILDMDIKFRGHVGDPCGTFHELFIKSPAFAAKYEEDALQKAAMLQPAAKFRIKSCEQIMGFYIFVRIKYIYCSVYKNKIIAGKSRFIIGFDFDEPEHRGYGDEKNIYDKDDFTELYISNIEINCKYDSVSRLEGGNFVCEDVDDGILYKIPRDLFDEMLYNAMHFYIPAEVYYSGKTVFQESDYLPVYLKYKL